MNNLAVTDDASQETHGLTVQTDNLVARRHTGAVSANERPLRLTGTERRILRLLILHKGKTLTKQALVDDLYERAEKPDAKIIDVFICKLRKKIAEATGRGSHIETVWGRGYAIRDPDTVAKLSL